jgi:ATP-binding cassette subfamily B protein
MRLPGTLYRGTISVEKRNDYEYEIEFHDVTFQYPGTEECALKHLNLKLRIGQRLAVVGMNGSGKTTMIKLLCRLYDPQEGEILLNGVNIKEYDYTDYLEFFSVVFQDYIIFSFTVGENVAVASEYEKEKVQVALEEAGFGPRLKELKDGVNTQLYNEFSEEGVEISGGEAQKIAIARALYKNAPYVILDEPTAALDPMAEAEIYSRLNSFIQKKGAVYISHRLSSCYFCDKIAVFDEGKLIEQGSHAQLMQNTSGRYYELWNAQAQYYTGKA